MVTFRLLWLPQSIHQLIEFTFLHVVQIMGYSIGIDKFIFLLMKSYIYSLSAQRACYLLRCQQRRHLILAALLY